MSRRSAIQELTRHFAGEVLSGQAELLGYSTDFGGMVKRVPWVVLRPSSIDDVKVALRISAARELPLCVRGSGHGQSGHCLGDAAVLDMTTLDRVHGVDERALRVDAEAGATWYSIASTSFQQSFAPVGLTHALDPTLAGTLCIAGLGGQSLWCGPQVDNVEYLDVVGLDGEVVRCAAGPRADLFDSVRAGLGQMGVIVSAGYPVRRCHAAMRSRVVHYRDPAAFVSDLTEAAETPSEARWLLGAVQVDPFHNRRRCITLQIGAEVRPGATEVETPLFARGRLLAEREDALWRPDGRPTHGFFRSFRQERGTEQLNPWIEYLFEPARATEALERVFGLDDALLGSVKIGIVCTRRTATRARLFVTPKSDWSLGLGLFATFPGSERAGLEASLGRYEALMTGLGGKRYLSGYLNWTSTVDWAAHYGDEWTHFRAAKLRADPLLLLNSGAIPWNQH